MPRMGIDQLPRLIIPNGAGRYIQLPSLTTTQRDALAAVVGQVIYNSTLARIQSYEAGAWKTIGQVYGADTFLPLAGGTMTGPINFGSQVASNIYELVQSFLGEAKPFIFSPFEGGWTQAQTGSGSGSGSGGIYYVTTGATQDSTSRARLGELGLGGGINYSYIPWNKKMAMLVCPVPLGNNAAFVRYVHLKEVSTHGVLAEPGFGVDFANFAISGSSYGASGATVDLSTNGVSSQADWITILHDPTAPSIKWYVNGVLKGTQSTSAKISQSAGTAGGFIVCSVGNPGVAATCQLYIPPIIIWVKM